MLSALAKCQQSGARYLNAEMEAAKVKTELRPDFKAILQEMAHFNRETMADFLREAAHERIVRLLNEKIVAEEQLAAQSKSDAA